MMRRLLIIVVVLAAAYGGYWFVGARAVENGATNALAQMQADGWDVSYADLSTRGFPSRFDTTLRDVALTSPDGMLSYRAPFLQAFALSYQPNRVIAAFPTAQTIALAGQSYTLGSEGLRASAAVQANAGLLFDAATVEAQMLSLASDVAGVRTGPVLVALRAAAAPKTYDGYLALEKVTLPDDLWQQMFPHGALPLSIDSLVADVTVTLDQPLSRDTLAADVPPALTGMTLKNITLTWGDLSIRARGDLVIDALGVPTGRIDLTATRWDALINGLANIGVIDPGVAPTYLNMGEVMSGGAEVLEVPLGFQNGFMTIGPLPIGAAPRFR